MSLSSADRQTLDWPRQLHTSPTRERGETFIGLTEALGRCERLFLLVPRWRVGPVNRLHELPFTHTENYERNNI